MHACTHMLIHREGGGGEEEVGGWRGGINIQHGFSGLGLIKTIFMMLVTAESRGKKMRRTKWRAGRAGEVSGPGSILSHHVLKQSDIRKRAVHLGKFWLGILRTLTINTHRP